MKLRFLFAMLGTAGVLSTSVTLAQPAIYRDGAMTITSGAIITGSRQDYYGDIVLNADSTGKLTVASATRLPLVHVDSVTTNVTIDTVSSVSLDISGYKSVPCVALKPAAISRKGTTFTVLLAESVLGPAESCIAVIDPFELNLPLDIKGLDYGVYEVDVNGVSASFTLPIVFVP